MLALAPPSPPTYRVLWLGRDFPASEPAHTGIRFTLHRTIDASAALSEMSASFKREARYAVIFVDPETFGGLSHSEVVRVIHCLDPDIEIAFIGDPADDAPSNRWLALPRPVRWADVVRIASTLASRWRFADRGPHAPDPASAASHPLGRQQPRSRAHVIRRAGLTALRLMALLCFIPLLTGWRAERSEPAICTGTVLTAAGLRAQLPNAILGTDRYAEVNSHWLIWYYDEFRTDLASGGYGIVQWEQKFNCTAFVSRYASSAQLRYFVRTFYRWHSPDGIAIGEFWYRPAGSNVGHALVAAFTEKGLLYLDPQNGHFVTLTSDERLTAYLRKFD